MLLVFGQPNLSTKFSLQLIISTQTFKDFVEVLIVINAVFRVFLTALGVRQFIYSALVTILFFKSSCFCSETSQNNYKISNKIQNLFNWKKSEFLKHLIFLYISPIIS